MNNEIGRELKAHELVAPMIVVTDPSHRPEFFITCWVESVEDCMVFLLAAGATPPIHLGLFRQPDGSLRDGLDRTIRIFEYLGAECDSKQLN